MHLGAGVLLKNATFGLHCLPGANREFQAKWSGASGAVAQGQSRAF